MKITKEKTTTIGIGIHYTTLSDLLEYKKEIKILLFRWIITLRFKRNKHPIKDYFTSQDDGTFSSFADAYIRRAKALNLPNPFGKWVSTDEVLKHYNLPTYSGDNTDTANKQV
jgi:hypothetical protein